MAAKAPIVNRNFRLCLTLGLALLAFGLLWPGGQLPLSLRDSPEYLSWSSRRGVGYPFVLWVLGSGAFLPLAQTAISLACWMYLGRQAGGLTGMVLALVPALTLEIEQYNLLILSESLSIPLFALVTGLTLRLLRRPAVPGVVIWCVLLMLFAFTRASNLYLVFCLPLVLALRHRALALVGLSWCVALLLMNKGMDHDPSGRYKAETMNHVYLYRVLPDGAARAHFVAKGLPMHTWTMSYVAAEPRIAVYNAHLKAQAHELLDTYPDYQQWMIEHGRREYLKWLLARPASYLEVFAGIRHALETQVLHAEGMRLPKVSLALDWRYRILGRAPILLWLACLLIPAGEFLRTRRLPEGEALALLVMIPLAYAHAFLSYHGHPGDVSRYLLPTTAFFRLSLLLAAAWLLRRLIAAGRRRYGPDGCGRTPPASS